MAIQTDLQTDAGLSVSGAYMRITDILVTKNNEGVSLLTFGVATHVSKEKRDQKNPTCPMVYTNRYQTVYDSAKELWNQAYTYLKTLYPGAKDV